MADTSELTPTQALPLPHPGNQLGADVHRLRAATQAIDAALAALQTAMGAKAGASAVNAAVNSLNQALANHAGAAAAHTKAQVGLGNVDNTSDLAKPVSTATQAMLDQKVDKTGLKTVGGQSLLGPGNIEVSAWKFATSEAAHDGTDLAIGTRYVVLSGTNRYLPAAATQGDRIALVNHDGALFGAGTWQLRRRNPAHTIKGLAEDATFNYPQAVVTLEYTGGGKWAIA